MLSARLNVPRAFDVLILAFATLGLIILFGPALAAGLGSPWGNVFAQIVLILAPAALFLVAGRFELKASLPLSPPGWRGLVGGVCMGLSLWLPALLAVNLARQIFGAEAITEVDDILRETLTESGERVGAVGVLFVFAALPGIAEELLFRGVILPAFLRERSFWVGVFGNALLFGLFHLNVPQGFATVVIGSFLAYAVGRTNSLWVSVVAHAVHNTVVLAAATLLGLPEEGEAESLPALYLAVPFLALALLWIGVAILPRTGMPKDPLLKED